MAASTATSVARNALSLASGTAEEWTADFNHVAEDPLHLCPGLGQIVDNLEGADAHTKLMRKIDRCLTSGKVVLAASGGAAAEAVMIKIFAQAVKMKCGETIPLTDTSCTMERLDAFFVEHPHLVEVCLAALCTHPTTANI